MTVSPDLLRILGQVAGGESTIQEAAETLMQTTSLGAAWQGTVAGACVDLGRQQRCGFPEVVFGEGKSSELICEIVQTQLAAGQSALVTRLDPASATQVRRCFQHACHNPIARTLRVAAESITPAAATESADRSGRPYAAVITAGSTDSPVAEEATETLAWMEVPYLRIDDVGVAGPQRLLSAADRLTGAAAVVVIAGLEGALPAAVAGHVSCPVFAVPSSVGYGISLGGITPLLGMLSSCAANVSVVGIDAGFKGGYLAGMVTRRLIDCLPEDGRKTVVAPETSVAPTLESS
ncbi:MAG: nickel pincer cofactor biosynthesis protein LarB [Planctomycetota bacterium]